MSVGKNLHPSTALMFKILLDRCTSRLERYSAADMFSSV